MSDHLLQAKSFAEKMDSQYTFLGIRFGYDVLLSIVPIIGPIISFCISLKLLAVVPKLDISFRQKYMSSIGIVTLLLFDFALGSIPLIGIFIDVFFRANTWAVRMLHADELGLTMFSEKDR